MRVLHTSDWHVGRTFHGYDTLPQLDVVIDGIATVVRDQGIDVVVISGDIFDRSSPSAASFEFLDDALVAIRSAGAQIVLISGNHDGAQRLAFMSRAAAAAGIHTRTKAAELSTPVQIKDEHGDVLFYCIPYLEPILARHELGDHTLRTHEGVLGAAMDRIRADLATREETRSVVLSHCFALGGRRSDTERDIAVGGVESVPTEVFDGPSYIALGHLHSRQSLTERIRYSGAPIAYSFGEADKPRGAWIVDLGPDGLTDATWVDLPIPRRLSVIEGTIGDLLANPTYADLEQDWVSAILTDDVRPLDAMARLKNRFAFCAHLSWQPQALATSDHRSYQQRLRGKSDLEIAVDFVGHVRNGVPADQSEMALIRQAFEDVRIEDDRAETRRR